MLCEPVRQQRPLLPERPEQVPVRVSERVRGLSLRARQSLRAQPVPEQRLLHPQRHTGQFCSVQM